MAKQAGHVIAVEKDPRLASHLRTEFGDNPTISIIQGDVLKTEIPPFNKVVGTPPYTLSSKLTLLLTKKRFDLASLVFQKEFGKRLIANAGTADYGRLSITAQRFLTIEPLMSIPASAFRPKPKVDSILLRMQSKSINPSKSYDFFDDLVRGLFTQRRRVLRSALTHFLSKKMGRDKARIALQRRSLPEKRVYQLTIEDLENLARELYEASPSPQNT